MIKAGYKFATAFLAVIIAISFMPMTAFANDTVVTVDGQTVQFIQPVRTAQGSILAPIEPIANMIGAEVRWNEATRTATIIFGNTGVAVAVGNTNITMRNMTTGTTETFTMPIASRIYDGVHFMPITYVTWAMGLRVEWPMTNLIQIMTSTFVPSDVAGGTQTTTPTVPAQNVVRTYLESNIMSVAQSRMTRYPASGSFNMGGTTFFRGITSDWWNESTITYNIAGEGFTRLTGTFGRTGDEGGTMTITGDGVFLGGFSVTSTGAPTQIDVAIPAGTQQIIIRLHRRLGFGDAAFSGGAAQQAPTHAQPTAGMSFLESNIMSAAQSRMTRYPASGSFNMGGTTFFRGITSDWWNESTITYNIGGLGYTRLTGTFGRTGDEGGTMTITGDGMLLGGFEVSATGAPTQIDVAIPTGTQQVVIRLQRRLGFGEAVFQ